MAIIFIEQLAVTAHIGVYAHEKTQPQPLLIDLQCAVDIYHAAATDDLNQTLDYDKLVAQIHAVINQQHYQLLETLANNMADTLYQMFTLSWLQLKISKPQAIATAKAAGIIVERGTR